MNVREFRKKCKRTILYSKRDVYGGDCHRFIFMFWNFHDESIVIGSDVRFQSHYYVNKIYSALFQKLNNV